MKKNLFFASLLLAASAFGSDILHIYNWNNYLADDAVKRFEVYCHCRLAQDFYGDNEEMLAKFAAGAKGYDIVVPTGFAIQPLVGQGLALPLDKSRLPALVNMNPDYMNAPFDRGNRYTLPYAITTTVIGYNETQMKRIGLFGKVNSWALIFDPKLLAKIKGRVTVLDSPRELIAAALMYLGKNANSDNLADWRAARDVILKAKPYWAAFNSQSYIKELTVGNIWVAFGYSNDLFQAQQDVKSSARKFKVNFGLQKEGNTISLDNFVILKDAPRKDLAYKFINFMLSGRNASGISNEVGAGSPNKAAIPYINPQIVAQHSIFPRRADLPKLHQLLAITIKDRRELNRIWTEIKLR